MKKALVILMCAVLLVSTGMLTGCGGGGGTETVNQPSESAEAAPESAGGETPKSTEKYTLRVGLVLDDSNPHTIALKTVFKPYVEEQSGGNITVEVYPNSQLGSDRQTVEALALGTMEMSAPSASILPSFDENFNVLDLPYVFGSVESARKALDGELGDHLKESLAQKDILLLGFGDSGFRQLSNSKKPVSSPEDMQGMSIRVMENPLHISAFKAFGANPTPMAFSELFTALQQGTVDGQDNSIIVTHTSKLLEAQKYFTLTEHVYGINCYLINKTLFDGMPEEYQTIVQDGVKEAMVTHRQLVDEMEDQYLEEIKAGGIEVTELTPEQKQAFIDRSQSVYEEFEQNYDAKLIELATKYN